MTQFRAKAELLQPSLTTRTQDLENRIDDLAAQMVSWSAADLDWWNQWFKNSPLRVGNIRWVAWSLCHATILPTFKTTSKLDFVHQEA